MNYNVYKQARDASWRFLLENNISELPLRLGAICERNGILLLRDMHNTYLKSNQRGVTYIRDNRYVILVNGADTLQIQRYTIAHELGHIYMKHEMTDGILGRSFGIHYHPVHFEEYQAERFAMDILAPACVLHELHVHAAKDISSLCSISFEDAHYRAERMRQLFKKNKFFTSDVEKSVFVQFEEYIKYKKMS